MNNIVAKNIINGVVSKNDLPYSRQDDVGIRYNQIVSESINDGFNKLVENDLFIERQLNDVNNYEKGPKTYDEQTMKFGPHGTKLWNEGLLSSPDTQISILHKYIFPVSATLSTSNLQSQVNFIQRIGGTTVVGTDDGLYTQNDVSGIHEWTNISSGLLSAEKCNSYYIDDSVFYVAGRSGVYSLTNLDSIQNMQDESLDFVKIRDGEDISGVCMVGQNIWTARRNGLFKDDQCVFDRLGDSLIDVAGVIRAGGSVYAQTPSAVYTADKIRGFTEIIEIPEVDSKTLIDTVEYGGLVYAIDSAGITKIDGLSAERLAGFSGNAVGMAVCDGNLYAVSESTVYMVSDDGVSSVKDIPEIRAVNSLNGILYVLTDKSIYVKYKDETWLDEEFNGGRLLIKCRNGMYVYSERDGSVLLTYIRPFSGGLYVFDEKNFDPVFNGKRLRRTVVFEDSIFYITDHGILDHDFRCFNENWDFNSIVKNENYLFAAVTVDGEDQLAYCESYKDLSKFKLVPNLTGCRHVDTYGSWLVFSNGGGVSAVNIDELSSLNDIGADGNQTTLQNTIEGNAVKAVCFVKNGQQDKNIYVFRENEAYVCTYDTRINDLSIDFGEEPTDQNPVTDDFVRYLNGIAEDTQIRDIVENTLINYATLTGGGLEERYSKKTAVIDSNGNVYCVIRPIADEDGAEIPYFKYTGDDVYKKYSLKQVFDISDEPDEDTPLNFKKFRFPVYMKIFIDLPDEYSGKLKPTTQTSKGLPVYTCEGKISSYGIYDDNVLLAIDEKNTIQAGSIIYPKENYQPEVQFDNFGLTCKTSDNPVGIISMHEVGLNDGIKIPDHPVVNMFGTVFCQDGNIDFISAVKSNEPETKDEEENFGTIDISVDGNPAILSGIVVNYQATLSCFNFSKLPSEIGPVAAVSRIASDTNNRFAVVAESGKIYVYRGYKASDDGTRKDHFDPTRPESYSALSNFIEIELDGIPDGIVQSPTAEAVFGLENGGVAIWIKLGSELYFGATDDITDKQTGDSTTASLHKAFIRSDGRIAYYYSVPYIIGNFGRIRAIYKQLNYHLSSEIDFKAERLEYTSKDIFAWDRDGNIYEVPDLSAAAAGKYSHINLKSGKYYLMDGNGLSSSSNADFSDQTEFRTVRGKNVVDVAFSKSGAERYAVEKNGVVRVYQDSYKVFTRYTVDGSPVGNPGQISWSRDAGVLPYVKKSDDGFVEILDTVVSPSEISCIRSSLKLENGNSVKTAGERFDVDQYGDVYTKSGEKIDVPFDFTFEKTGYGVVRKNDVSSFCRIGDIGDVDVAHPVIENIHNCRNMRLFDDRVVYMSDSGINILYPQMNSTALRTRLDARDANLVVDVDGNGQKYLMFDDQVYTIDDDFRKKSMSAFIECPAVNAIQKNSEYEYLLGTNTGLKYTKYSYMVDNDLSLCSTADLEGVLAEKYQAFIEEHIRKSHGEDDPITKINNGLMPKDCSVLEGVMNNQQIQNIVESVEFDGYIPYIRAAVEFKSPLSVYNDDDLSAKWIFRKYMKNREGELFIYLPTTNTRYVNHVDEIDSCQMLEDEFTRENTNLKLSRSIEDNTTHLSVIIDKEHFKIDSVYFQQINVNSLPLDMYRDFANRGKCGNTRFSTVVKQSSIVSPDYTEDNGNIILKYICFGSDAQALHLMFNFYIDYTIEFNGNGQEEGEMDAQKCRSSEKIKLNPCKYRRNGYIFLGWSRDKYAFEPEFLNNEEIYNITDKENDVVTLYAVWQLYRFNNGATVLKIKTDADPINLDYAERTEDASNVFVDYDYSVDTILTLKSNGKPFSIAHGVGLTEDSIIAIDFDYREDEDEDEDVSADVSADISSDVSVDISSDVSADVSADQP